MVYRVGLLGLGTVGTGVVEILQRPPHPLLQAVEIAAVGVRSLDKPRQVAIPPERLTTNLEGIVSDPEIDAVIELMGGLEPARSLILKAIDHGKPVITANKAVIARSGKRQEAQIVPRVRRPWERGMRWPKPRSGWGRASWG